MSQLAQEEKISLLTGINVKESSEIPRLGIPAVTFVDGPHSVQEEKGRNATFFPSLCSVAATWGKDMVYRLGETLAEDCIRLNVALLIAPTDSMEQIGNLHMMYVHALFDCLQKN